MEGRMKMKRWIIFAVALALPALIQSPWASAAPNPHNAEKCLLCHKEKPRFGTDSKETVTFRNATWDDPRLCSYCHKPEENLHPLLVEPGPDAADTMAPRNLPLGDSGEFQGKVVCTTCHFIHASDDEHALLRGFPGAQKPKLFSDWQKLCRECHGKGLEKRSPHAGDDRACAFCHQAKPVEGQAVTVLPRGVALCNFCHGGVQDEHYQRANPFEGEVDCLSCHDPHLGSDSPARLKPRYAAAVGEKVTISPHYREGLCFTCHAEGEKYPLRDEDINALCNRCHGSPEVVGDIHPLRKVPESISVPEGWPVTDGGLTCLTCHLAGHPGHRGVYKFLRGGPYKDRGEFCLNCHSPESYKDRNPHRDINQGKGCEFCHAVRPVPGVDNARTVRFIADLNILCLRCHDATDHPAAVEHTISLNEDRAETIPDELPLFNSDSIVCATCHNPHIEEVEGHKLRGSVEGMMICSLCHRF